MFFSKREDAVRECLSSVIESTIHLLLKTRRSVIISLNHGESRNTHTTGDSDAFSSKVLIHLHVCHKIAADTIIALSLVW